MVFSTDTFSKAAFKRMQGLAHTSNDKDPANEAEGSQFTLTAGEIFSFTPDPDPLVSWADGYVAYVTLDLDLDPSSNGNAYFASITTVSGSELNGEINPRTGLEYDDGDRVGFLVPPAYGSDYRVVLKDGGIEIPPLASEDWFFDYRAGILFSETDLNLSSGTVDGYVYIGRTVQDDIQSGLQWLRTGFDIYNKNSGFVGVNNQNPQHQLHVSGGNTITTSQALYVDGAVDASSSSDIEVIKFDITANTGTNGDRIALKTEIAGTYDGTGYTAAIEVLNDTVPSGGSFTRVTDTEGAIGILSDVDTGSDYTFGIIGRADGAVNENYGGFFTATGSSGDYNVGLFAAAYNDTTDVAALYASVGTGGGPTATYVPSGISGVIIANSGDTTEDLIVGLDETTRVFTVQDDGRLGIGTEPAPNAHIHAHDTSGNTKLILSNDGGTGAKLAFQDSVAAPVGDVELFQDNSNSRFSIYNNTTATYPLSFNFSDGHLAVNSDFTTGTHSVPLHVFENGAIEVIRATALPFSASGAVVSAEHFDAVALDEDDILGVFAFRGSVSSTYSEMVQAADISAVADDDWAAGDTASRIEFSVTASGTDASSVQMVLDSDGNLGISSSDPSAKVDVVGTSTGSTSFLSNGILLNATDSGTDSQTGIAFRMQGPSGTGSNAWFFGLDEEAELSLHYGDLPFTSSERVAAFVYDTANSRKGLHLAVSGNGRDTSYIRCDWGTGFYTTMMGGVLNADEDSLGNTFTGVTSSSFLIGNIDARDLHLGVDSETVISIDASLTKYVGIGTNSPSGKLHIRDDSIANNTPMLVLEDQSKNSDVFMQFISADNTYAVGNEDDEFVISDDDDIDNNKRFVITAAGDVYLNAGTSDSNFSALYHNNAAVLTVTRNEEDSDPGVGIGTTSIYSRAFDVFADPVGVSVVADFVAQIVNTNTADSVHNVLKLAMAEATADVDSSDNFLVCYSEDDGTSLGTVEYRISGDGTTATSFTSQHWAVYQMQDGYDIESEIIPGMIVESVGIVGIDRNIENAIPIITKTITADSKKVFGVFSTDWNTGSDMSLWNYTTVALNSQSKIDRLLVDGYYDAKKIDKATYSDTSPYFKARVNSGGEGKIWVSNIDGYIENGDLISSSTISGYGKLQSDDIIRSYTVAKSTQDVDWDSIIETVTYNGNDYKVALISCIYHCG